MPIKGYKYVEREDVRNILLRLQQQGVPKSEWTKALDDIVPELDYRRHRQRSAKGLGMVPKAAVSATPGFLGGAMEGIAGMGRNIPLRLLELSMGAKVGPGGKRLRMTPTGFSYYDVEEKGLTKLRQRAKDITAPMLEKSPEGQQRAMRQLQRGRIMPFLLGELFGMQQKMGRAIREKGAEIVPKHWARETAEAQAGPKWGPGAVSTWSALAGGQIPLVTTGALADPVTGMAMMSGVERTGFMEASGMLAIDDDIAEKYADLYGPMSGSIEYVQNLGRIGPFKKQAVQATKPMIQRMLRFMGKELAVHFTEGFEEMTQGYLFNKTMDMAIAEQNERNAAKGLPPVDQNVYRDIRQKAEDNFAMGAGISAIFRGTGVGTRGLMNRVNKARQYTYVKRLEKHYGAPIEKLVEKQMVIPRGERPYVGPMGGPLAEKQARMEPPSERTLRKIDQIPNGPELRKLAEAWGVPKELRKSYKTTRQALKERVGAVPEGLIIVPRPRTKAPKDGITFNGREYGAGQTLPETGVKMIDIVNKPEGPEVKQGQILEEHLLDITKKENTIIDEATGQTMLDDEGKPIVDQDAVRSALNATRWKALANVVGEQIADFVFPAADVQDTSLTESPHLERVLTRRQYAEYKDNIEGVVREKLRNRQMDDFRGEIAQNQLSSDLEAALMLAPIELDDGSILRTTEVPVHQRISWFRRYMGLQPSMEVIANSTGLPLPALDEAMYEGNKTEAKLNFIVQIYKNRMWRAIPRALRAGLPGKRMGDLVAWLMSDPKQKAGLVEAINQQNKQDLPKKVQKKYRYKKRTGEYVRAGTQKVAVKDVVENNVNSMVAHVARASTLKDRKEIRRIAEDLKEKHQKFFGWFAKNNIVSPDKFRTNYVPVYRLYSQETTGKKAVSFEQWARERAVRLRKEYALEEVDIENLVDIADTMKHFDKHGVPIAGMSPQFMEYARNQDKLFLDAIARVTDIRQLYDLYARKAFRRLVYGPIAPAVRNVIIRANQVLRGRDRDRFNMTMSNYMESMMGIPDNAAKSFMETKILPRSLTVQAVNITNRAIDKYNRTLLGKALPIQLMQAKDPSAKDALDLSMTYMYATTLGLPFNWKSPIKNLTQGPLVIAAVGIPRYLQGMWLLLHNFFGDGADIKTMIEMDLRPEHKGWEFERLGTSKGSLAMVAQAMLSPYRTSDLLDVYSSAAAGLVGWKKLEALMGDVEDGSNLTDQQIINVLWQGGTGMGKGAPPAREVMAPEHMVDSHWWRRQWKNRKAWKKVISRPAALTVIDLIRTDRKDAAKKFYLQFLVNLSQWRYGPGGTPGALRNSAMRGLFMYTSWPINYIDYVARLTRPGMIGRTAQFLSSQLLIAAALTAVGLPAAKWVLTGPIPDKLLPLGPLGDLIQTVLRIITSGSTGFIQGLVGAPEEDREKSFRSMERAFKDLFE